METTDSPARRTIERISEDLSSHEGVVVAFSGGVDSSTVASLAHRALGEDAVACTAVSETLSEEEYHDTVRVADEIGIRHEVIEYSELNDKEFVQNNEDRCYHCRTGRLREIFSLAEELGFETVADGTNASDSDPDAHRPGLRAVKEVGAYSPLLEHGVTNDEVRKIAHELCLSVWDKPSMACLSSRIPHGTEVTENRLSQVERAERVLHERGFVQFRVRDHDDVARVEIAPEEIEKALDRQTLREIHDEIASVGFEYVALDMKGYRTGSLSPTEDLLTD